VLRGAIVVGLGLLAGCYDPTFRNCAVDCVSTAECAPTQVCGADGWCASAEVAGHCNEIRGAIDAQPSDAAIDATPDADNSACAAVCTNGTCVGGVCTIDCSGIDTCANDVFCPAGVPCHVVCGDKSCDHHVDCTQSTACTVECTGATSCLDEVRCGTGPCDVTCSGYRSCAHRAVCPFACSCDVTCTGTEACHDPALCPGSACIAGDGCTSAPSGCDQCAP